MRPPDGKWGSQEANGSWNGMVGMLHRGEVDMALGPLGITRARCMCWRPNPARDLTNFFLTLRNAFYRQREEACDFSSALAVDEWFILVRAPDIAADPLAMTRWEFIREIRFPQKKSNKAKNIEYSTVQVFLADPSTLPRGSCCASRRWPSWPHSSR